MTTCPSCNEWVSDHHLCPVTARKPPGGTPNRPPDLKVPAAEAAQSPQVGAPVASADPELVELLREARNAIDELHGMYAYADLLTGIDSALSRLAGPGK